MQKYLKNLKRTIILLALIASLLLAACGGDTKSTNKYIIAAPDGLPLLSISYSAGKNEKIAGAETTYRTIFGGATGVIAEINKAEADFIIAPVNVAAKTYTGGGEYHLLAVSTLGNLTVISKEDITSIDDLVGKNIYLQGMGGSPEAVLKAVLGKNGIGYSTEKEEGKVQLSYKNDGAEIIAGIAVGTITTALLTEPVTTKALARFSDFGRRLDLAQEFKILYSHTQNFAQAGLLIKAKYKDNTALISDLMSLLQRNSDFLVADPQQMGGYAVGLGSVALTAADVVAASGKISLSAIRAGDIKDEINAYLNILAANSAPNDNFYV